MSNSSSFKMNDVHEDNVIEHNSSPAGIIIGVMLILGILLVVAAFYITPSREVIPEQGGEIAQFGEPGMEQQVITAKPEGASSDIIHLTDADFAEKTQEGVILVDFYTTWCPPCKAMEPTLEKIATDLKGRAQIVKIDAEANPKTSTKFEIKFYPTLYLLKDGKVVDFVVGMQSESQLLGLMKSHLPEKSESPETPTNQPEA